jgi:hypothetical protein
MGENIGRPEASSVKRETRRTFIPKIAAATAVFLGLAKAKGANAQALPISDPESPASPELLRHHRRESSPPSQVKERVEKAVELFRSFINESPDVKVKYSSSENPNAHSDYLSTNTNSGDINLKELAIEVYYPKDLKYLDYLDLLVKQQLAVLASRSFNNYPSEMLARDFEQYTGTHLESLEINRRAFLTGKVKAVSANDSASQQARLSEIKSYFDISKYVDSTIVPTFGDSMSREGEKLYANAMALWTSEVSLGQRIKTAPESDRKMLANVFLSALKRGSDYLGAGKDFNNSGINQQSLNDLLQLSGNETYQKYFSEKRNPRQN